MLRDAAFSLFYQAFWAVQRACQKANVRARYIVLPRNIRSLPSILKMFNREERWRRQNVGE